MVVAVVVVVVVVVVEVMVVVDWVRAWRACPSMFACLVVEMMVMVAVMMVMVVAVPAKFRAHLYYCPYQHHLGPL